MAGTITTHFRWVPSPSRFDSPPHPHLRWFRSVDVFSLSLRNPSEVHQSQVRLHRDPRNRLTDVRGTGGPFPFRASPSSRPSVQSMRTPECREWNVVPMVPSVAECWFSSCERYLTDVSQKGVRGGPRGDLRTSFETVSVFYHCKPHDPLPRSTSNLSVV